MAGDSHLDPIILTLPVADLVVTFPGEETTSVRWYKIPDVKRKSFSAEIIRGGAANGYGGMALFHGDGSLLSAGLPAVLNNEYPTVGDLYLVFAGATSSISGGFGVVPGGYISQDLKLTASQVLLQEGEDEFYPVAVDELPFTYVVPPGFPGSEVFFSVTAAIAADAYPFISTLGSSVPADVGLKRYQSDGGSYWQSYRGVPASRGGLQEMAFGHPGPTAEFDLVSVLTTGAMPAGLQVDIEARYTSSVQGVVRDSSGAPVQRNVLLILRDPEQPHSVDTRVSDPVTGEFVFDTEVWNGEYSVVAIDPGADLNDRIERITVTDSIPNPYMPP